MFSAINFPLGTVLAASHNFNRLCFHFHLVLNTLISILTSPLSHGLFRSGLFNFSFESGYFGVNLVSKIWRFSS